MNATRLQSAIERIRSETARPGAAGGPGVIVLAQGAAGELELPALPGRETFSFLLGGAATDIDADDGTLATTGGDVISLLVCRERFGQLALALSPTDPRIVFSLVHSPSERGHTPDWIVSHMGDGERLRELLALIVVTYAERADGWESQVDALTLALITLWVADGSPRKRARGMSGDAALAVALREIAARPESVTLSELARRLSYNPNYLSGLLRASCGKTFSQLLIEQRMERARLLLRETQLPASEVARMTGYAGTSNFYRHFREVCGTSPSEYRAASRTSQVSQP